METCVLFCVIFFLDAFISSAVGITVLFILYGESMALLSVRFFIFCFIFLKKCEMWVTFLYYLCVFWFCPDDVSFLQKTKIKMLHYNCLIHAFLSAGKLSVLLANSCSMEYFQNGVSVVLCEAHADYFLQHSTWGKKMFGAQQKLVDRPHSILLKWWILTSLFLYQLCTSTCFCCTIFLVLRMRISAVKYVWKRASWDTHFILLVLN